MTLRRGALLAAIAVLLAGCGGSGSRTTRTSTAASGTRTASATTSVAQPRPRPAPALYPRLLPPATAGASTHFVPAASWQGQAAVWVAQRSGVTLLSFNQRLVILHLHSGTVDAGSSGWRYGPAIAGLERRRLLGAFNGGFKLSVGAGGFASGGRVAAALGAGLGSIVTYANGQTDIGAWHQGVPAGGQPVVSVRQNLHLLISARHPAANLACLLCWGATLGGTATPARSALGITASDRLIWAGGENLTTAALAAALQGAGVQRAVELDINPEWVAAYLYSHRHGPHLPVFVPMVPGQHGIPGEFLAPYSRDFFTVVVR